VSNLNSFTFERWILPKLNSGACLPACLALIGWNPRQRGAIVAEGFTNIDDLRDMLLKDFSHTHTTISKLLNVRGGVRIGCALIRRLKGFISWVKDHQRCGQIADQANWTLQV
jgi:hypothetical protein